MRLHNQYRPFRIAESEHGFGSLWDWAFRRPSFALVLGLLLVGPGMGVNAGMSQAGGDDGAVSDRPIPGRSITEREGAAGVLEASQETKQALEPAQVLRTGGDPTDSESWGPFEAVSMRYHTLDEVSRLLDNWAQTGGDRVQAFRIGGEIPAIEFGGGALGRSPLAKRRTVLLVGGMDGVSIAGGEAILHACHHLLLQLPKLREDLSVIAIPWASPKTLAQLDQGRVDAGRDLDGDGLVLQMLVEHANGPWARSTDPRFLVPARAGDAPRYELRIEGQLDALQGEGAQVPLTTTIPDDLFPVAHASSLGVQTAGANEPHAVHKGSPADHPIASYLQALMLERSTACVVVFQGNHGGIAVPGAGTSTPWETAPDAVAFQRIAQAFGLLTGRRAQNFKSLREARGRASTGSFIDWCYTVPGVLAFEVAVWGPSVKGFQGPEGGLDSGDLDAGSDQDAWSLAPPLDESARQWAHWLDNVRGGMGFARWRPLEQGQARPVLVGGWKPKTFRNPPEETLAEAMHGIDKFVHSLVEQQARLELCDVAVERDGELCTVEARLRCAGALPLYAATHGRWPGAGAGQDAWLALDVPASMRELAGASRLRMPQPAPGSKSELMRWLLMAPGGSRLGVEFGWRHVSLGQQEITL